MNMNLRMSEYFVCVVLLTEATTWTKTDDHVLKHDFVCLFCSIQKKKKNFIFESQIYLTLFEMLLFERHCRIQNCYHCYRHCYHCYSHWFDKKRPSNALESVPAHHVLCAGVALRWTTTIRFWPDERSALKNTIVSVTLTAPRQPQWNISHPYLPPPISCHLTCQHRKGQVGCFSV